MEAIEVKHIEEHFENGKWIKEQTIEIFYDEFAESPREWDNMTKMWFYHNRYILGDNDNEKLDKKDYKSWNELEDAIVELYSNVIIRPVYIYDHSGITISTSRFNCLWDSELIGFVFITHDTLEKKYGNIYDDEGRVKDEIIKLAINILNNEINSYDSYLRGEVYYYDITDKDGELVDSCGGFNSIEDAYECAEMI